MGKNDISLLPPEAVAGLKLSQAKKWSIAKLRALSPEAAAAIPTAVFNGLPAAKKAALQRS